MISAIVLTKNEEKKIEECLVMLEWCDEIIIVDDYSEDKTIEKIQNSKVQNYNSKFKIYKRRLNEDFAAQRNYGLEKARGDWVFLIDADERVTNELRKEILQKITQIDRAGFYLKRKDFLFGKWLKYGETGKVRLLRLAKKNAGRWVRPVHEVWRIEGKVGELKNPLLHYPHQTIKEFLEDINFYTTLNAQVFFKEGIKASFWQILVYPLAKFVKNYFFHLGFLDGMPGLLQAIFMSFHSFLTRAKLWYIWQKNV